MPSKSPYRINKPYADAQQSGISETDLAQVICSEWLARHTQHEKLIKRWQRLESKLIREHDWFKLSDHQRGALPEAAELAALDEQLACIHTQNQKVLQALPRVVATSLDGLAAKLSVAMASVPRDENLRAHLLVSSILRDLKAMPEWPQ